MEPFTVVLAVVGALVVLYGVVTFVSPRRGRGVSQRAIDSSEAYTSARLVNDTNVHESGGFGSSGIGGP